MRSLQLIQSRKSRDFLPRRTAVGAAHDQIPFSSKNRMTQFPALGSIASDWENSPWPHGTGEFFRTMSIAERHDFEALATKAQYFAEKVLIAEEQKPLNVLFLLEGEVNLSMNSWNGRQFLLGVAGPGEILGLASAISGDPSEIRAVARHPCKIASLHRQDFFGFLLRHPCASKHIAFELSLHCRRISERLRIFGLTTSVSARLASLLLAWCTEGRHTENGTHIRSALTQAEIGDCIGASRETITRTFTDFKNQDLVRVHGSTLIVPSRTALAIYAGIDSVSDRSNLHPEPL